MSRQEREIPDFKFLDNATALCLDFARTLRGRMTNHAQDLLHNYVDLVLWSERAQYTTEEQGRQLIEIAGRHNEDAQQVFQQAIDLRETIYRIFLAIAEHALPAQADMMALNYAFAHAMSHMRIVCKAGSFVWDWDDELLLDRVLWPIVRSAADLLTSDKLELVHHCASLDCSSLFIDTSKNHSRRWCDMAVCGNRAKARRHYERQQIEQAQSI